MVKRWTRCRLKYITFAIFGSYRISGKLLALTVFYECSTENKSLSVRGVMGKFIKENMTA